MKTPWTSAQRSAAAIVALAVLALVWWLDSASSGLALRPGVELHAAGVIFAVWTGIQFIGAALAAAADIAVAYLVAAISWLAGAMATMLAGLGSILAKVWDGLKIVWSDVLKPTLLWVDDKLKAAYSWMKSTFKPVFDFLNDVRARLNAFYNTFIKPITDTIDFIRAINRALLAFHITFLQDLDSLLAELEQRIREPFLWINSQLNKIQNVLELIVTLDGFFQQVTLIRSMSRYAPSWVNGMWNRQLPADGFAQDPYGVTRMYPLDAKWANGKALGQLYRGEPSRMDARVAELVPVFRIAAGIDPPDGPEDEQLAA